MIKIALLVLLLSISAVSAGAKEKQHNWQTGMLLDTDAARIYDGNTNYGSFSSADYLVYETYTIESGAYVYVCREHIKWRWSKPASLTVNTPIQFAIEKDLIYVKSEDGAVHETRIVKKILKAVIPPAQAAKTP